MIKKINVLLMVTVACFCGSAFGAQKTKVESKHVMSPAKLEGRKLIEALQKGGYVIFLRHHMTDDKATDKPGEALNNCDTQRNLIELGREGSFVIGKAFRKLGIKVSSVETSPYCRCLETARLAFAWVSDIKLNNDLQYAIYDGPEERKRKASVLRALLSQQPPEKTNFVIVSHTANLQEATAIWPKPEGVAIVFESEKGSPPKYVGKLSPVEWEKYMGE